MPAICPTCQTHETECGWFACPDCLDQYGEDPAVHETVAVNLAERRRDARKANVVWRAVNNLKTGRAA